MKITSIKQQVKRSDRYSIYVDDRYSFSLSERALLEHGVVSGKELTETEIAHLQRASIDDKLYQQTLRYVAMRARTMHELRSYLQRKQASPAFIEETVASLVRIGLLDDRRYAESFVRDRQTLKPTSRRKLVLELKQKRIDERIISEVLVDQAFDETTSLEQLIAKKRRQTKYQDDTKLMQYLARQGFNYGVIKQALHHDDEY